MNIQSLYNRYFQHQILITIFSSILCLTLTIYLLVYGKLGDALKDSTYYILWLTTFTYSYLLFLKKKGLLEDSKLEISNILKELGFSLFLVSILFLSIPVGLRILADETNLLNVSQAFFLKKEFIHPIETEYYYESLKFIQTSIPHRPGFFPFLVSIVHSLIGYNVWNTYIVNFLIGIFTSFIVIQISKKIWNRNAGWIAVVLLFSFPLYGLNITSGGFDAINLLFLLLIGLSIINFVKEPDGLNLELLFISIALGAQCRYETISLFLFAGIIFLWKYRPNKVSNHSGLLPFIPFLYLPILWQRLLSTELTNQGDSGQAAFQLQALVNHAKSSMEFFFYKNNPEYPVSSIIVFLFLIGLPLFFKKIKETDKDLFWSAVLILSSSLVIAFIHFAYYLGDYRFVFIMRYAVAHLGYFAIFGAIPIAYLYESKKLRPLAFFICIFLFLNNLSVASNNEIGKTLTLYREFGITKKFIEELPTKNILIISDRPSMYTALNRGSISYGYANKNIENLLVSLKRKLYQNIYVIQHFNYLTMAPIDKLDSAYPLELIMEFQNTGEEFVRIYKIVLQK